MNKMDIVQKFRPPTARVTGVVVASFWSEQS